MQERRDDMQKAKIFEAQIHDTRYRAEYYRTELTAGGLFHTEGRRPESLNGDWAFAVDQYDSCLRSRWFEGKSRDAEGRPLPTDYDYDRWERIPVPSCWNMVRERYFYYESSAVYTRTFRYIPERTGERVFIRFGAAQYMAFVFLNGKYFGFHRGGSTPFAVEATGLLREENRLLVVVDASRRHEQVPTEITDWFNYGGLYRDVELFRMPGSFIRDAFLRLVPGTGFRRIALDVRIDGPVQDGEGMLEIPGLGIAAPFTADGGKAVLELDAEPELWSPDRPRLYDVIVRFGGDLIRDRVGFREIAVRGTDVLLNGEPLFFRGISVHEESRANGKALTDAERRETLLLAKELGCNYMRLAHYPHDERMARIADELGIMLWEEVPVYWTLDFAGESTRRDAENQLAELMLRDRNRASVAVWSIGNENADTDERLAFMSGLARAARQLDPTRPVSAACLVDKENVRIADRLAEHLDIIGVNEYYGWYEPDIDRLDGLFANSAPGKPVFVCELGGGAKAGYHGTADELFTEECQERIYERQTTTIRNTPYVKGISPWILYDFRCPRRTNGFQEGYNRKGLLAEDKRTRKRAFAVLQRFYRDLAGK